MEASVKAQVNDIFLRANFRKEDAGFISELLDELDQKQETRFMQNKEYFLNKEDKVELIEKISNTKTELVEMIGNVKSSLNKSIYIVVLVQPIVIIGSVLGIVNFMLK